MNKHKLTEETYFDKKNELKYCGSSQIKAFQKCESMEMAKLNGEYIEEKSKALMIGSYVDNAISGTLDDFKEQNPDIFKRDGTLKADYIQADNIVNRIKSDEMFWKYVNGDHQTIMVGKIEGIPIKIKIDSYFPDKAIVDLKCVKDFKNVWNEETKQYENFIDYWGYTLQGALYQEIVYQNTGKKLPFIIAAITKETSPDLALLMIPDEVLEQKLQEIKEILPRIAQLKNKEIEPNRCEKCDYCRWTKKITKIIDYRNL